MRLPLAVRNALSLPVRRIAVRIRSGPAEGDRWSLPVSGRGIAAGAFEPEKFLAVQHLLRTGDVFWDVGAHYGYASLIGRRRVGPDGSVWCLEPSPHNRGYLRTHLRWNDPTGLCTVLPYALADADGEERFGGSGSSIAQKLGSGTEQVPVRSADSLVADGIPAPTVMKVDVEGAEERALHGAAGLLRSGPAAPLVLCAVHDPDRLTGCTRLLKEAGYAVVGSGPIRAWSEGTDRWRGDPDVLGIPPARESERERLLRTPLFSAGVDL